MMTEKALKTSKPKYEILPLEKISIKNNVRQFHNNKDIDELVESIQVGIGLQNPISVYQAGDGYFIKSGHRRFKAAQKAGLTEIPCIIEEAYPSAKSGVLEH
jgi:ParB family chromosome partitioning protein